MNVLIMPLFSHLFPTATIGRDGEGWSANVHFITALLSPLCLRSPSPKLKSIMKLICLCKRCAVGQAVALVI